MKKLIIIGAGGHGSETALVAADAGFEVKGFLDENSTKHHTTFNDIYCLGGFDLIPKLQDCEFVVAIGNSRVRRNIVIALKKFANIRYASIIHPTATILDKKNRIAEGAMIFPHACLMTNISLGAHAVLNVKSSVNHDCVAGDFLSLNPNATICGNCTIEDGVEIGASATIIQRITIEKGAYVGAGATVINAVSSNTLVVGVPAKPMKKLDCF